MKLDEMLSARGVWLTKRYCYCILGTDDLMYYIIYKHYRNLFLPNIKVMSILIIDMYLIDLIYILK